MQFSWDPDKAARNAREHEVTFGVSKRVFDDPFRIEEIDDREDYGEERWWTIGMVDTRCLHVVFTYRDCTIRIISAWKANRRERARYEEATI